MRGVKTKKELEKIEEACRITDTIFSAVLRTLRSKKVTTEIDLRDYIHGQMKKHGVSESFEVIVASGPGGAEPHHVPTEAPLRGFTVIDFGVIYKGYMSDMTRTVFIGNLTKKDRAIYEQVLSTQKQSIAKVADGIRCAEVDQLSRDLLKPYTKYYIHTLGHGVGKKIHEFPSIYKKSRFYLREGMAITIEPGVYFPGKFGIRIEDTCIVTKTGARILTKSNKDLIAI